MNKKENKCEICNSPKGILRKNNRFCKPCFKQLNANIKALTKGRELGGTEEQQAFARLAFREHYQELQSWVD